MFGYVEIDVELEVGSLVGDIKKYFDVARALEKHISYSAVRVAPKTNPQFSVKGRIDLAETEQQLSRFFAEHGRKAFLGDVADSGLWLEGAMAFSDPQSGLEKPLNFDVVVSKNNVALGAFNKRYSRFFLTDAEKPNKFVLENLEKLEAVAKTLQEELKPNRLVVGEDVYNMAPMVYWLECSSDYGVFPREIIRSFNKNAEATKLIFEDYLSGENRYSEKAKAVISKGDGEEIISSLRKNLASAEIDSLLGEVANRHPTAEFRKKDGCVYFKSSRTLPFTTSRKPPNYSENASLDFYSSLFLKMI